MLAWFWQGVEAVFPARCLGCAVPGSWWCEECDLKVVRITAPACPECRRLVRLGEYCRRCRRRTALTGVLAAAHLRDPLTDLVKALKYRHAREAAPILARELLVPLARYPRLGKATLVPVPLHSSRLHARGYNQSALLCELIVKVTGLPQSDSLVRIRATASQTGLDRSKRQRNVAEAFRWEGSEPSNTVILVDDVCTTGATLDACAKALRGAGAREVWGLVAGLR